MPKEQYIPKMCPNRECRTLLAANYSTHCEGWCGWVTCGECQFVIDTRNDRHMQGKKKAG